MPSHISMHHSSSCLPERPSLLRTYDSSPLIIPARTSSLHHKLTQLETPPNISRYGDPELLRSQSATSLNALLSDLDRQREQYEREQQSNLHTPPSTDTLAIPRKNKGQNTSFPRIFSRRTVMRYCSKTRLSSICGFKPTSEKGQQAETPQDASTTTYNKETKQQEGNSSERAVQVARTLPQSGSAFESSRNEEPAIRPDQLEHQIRRVGSRVKIEQVSVDIEPSRASIELVIEPTPLSSSHDDQLSKTQQNVQLGLGFYQQKKLEQATTAFRDAATAHNPVGQLLYGLALYYRWGCERDEEQALALIKKAATQGKNDVNMDLESISNTARVELALAIHELGIVFHTGWGCARDEHVTKFLLDIAGDLFGNRARLLRSSQDRPNVRSTMAWYKPSTMTLYSDETDTTTRNQRRCSL